MNLTRVFDLLPHSDANFKRDDVIAGKVAGIWVKYSTADFKEISDNVSRGLIALNIHPGEKVAIMSGNRPEWNFCDFGIMQTGATQVPMHPTLAENDIRFILKDAEVKIVFVSGKEIADKIQASCRENDVKIYSFDKIEGIAHWLEVVKLGKENPQIGLDSYREKIQPHDLLTLIYTSGTTGTPKGVMLTHNNLMSNVKASSVLYPDSYKKALSFLPLSHIFERMVIYMYFYLGISVYYAESMDTIVVDINDVKPDGFTTVPRLLEKVYDRIVAKGSEQTGIKKSIFFWALNLGLRYELDGKNGPWYEMQLALARKLVFKKWREALGGNIQAIVSGGAALQLRLAKVFWAAGIPVLEGYGLTETSPVIAVNGLHKGQVSFSSVGKPLKDVIVKIADDGEIMCKGPNVMKGYYKRPDLSAEVIDKDGFFHTGDIGNLSPEGFLCITDRKKEIFKTAGGKYVAPQVVENKFKESLLIEQVMVVGENRKFPAALIVPNSQALEEWCSRHDIPWNGIEDAIRNKRVIAKFQQEINHYNENFGHWEQIKQFRLLTKEWTIDNGEMTPKLSLKRKVILEKNKDIIEEIYASSVNPRDI